MKGMPAPELQIKTENRYGILPSKARENPPQRAIVHAMAEYVINADERYGPVGTFYAFDWLHRLGYSVHALITPQGEVIECVPLGRMAHHAKGHNHDTIGAEFLVRGEHDYSSFLKAIKDPDTYTGAMYKAGGWWYAKSGISFEQTFGHEDIDPERKYDPGEGFNWDTFQAWFVHYKART